MMTQSQQDLAYHVVRRTVELFYGECPIPAEGVAVMDIFEQLRVLLDTNQLVPRFRVEAELKWELRCAVERCIRELTPEKLNALTDEVEKIRARWTAEAARAREGDVK